MATAGVDRRGWLAGMSKMKKAVFPVRVTAFIAHVKENLLFIEGFKFVNLLFL